MASESVEHESIELSDKLDLESYFKGGEQKALENVNDHIQNKGDQNNVRHKEGNILLRLAVENNFKKVAEKLLEHRRHTKLEKDDNKRALQEAINKEYDDMSALIVRNMENDDIQSILTDSTENGIKKKLIKKPSDFTETLLAVFDSLKGKRKDDSVIYNDTKLLEEDDQGNLPGHDDFSYTDNTLFHTLADSGHREALNHPILKLLVKRKWKKWARNKFVVNFVLYCLSLFSLTFSVAVAVIATDVKVYDTSLQRARAVFEIVTYLFAFKGIVHELLQVIRHRLEYCKQLLNWLELITVLLLLLVLPVRYINTHAHWYIFATGYLLWVIKIFKYGVVFSATGAYAESLRTIFWRNFIPFSLLFSIVNLAFGGTYLLVLKGDGGLNTNEETSTLWDIWYVGLRTVIEGQPVIDYTDHERYRPVGTIVMLIFITMTLVVLLNILIAQITETYHTIQSSSRQTVVVNRAWIVARLERNSSPWMCRYFPKCLKRILSLSLDKKRRRAFKRYLPDKESNKHAQRSSPMEQISSTVATIENRLVKTDLKVQTVERSLQLIIKKIDRLQQKFESYSSSEEC